jgi:adenylyltransferase/sulfurtransferase
MRIRISAASGSECGSGWFLSINPDDDIIVHCKMGGRSAKAYEVLKKAGFTRIKNLKGGILAWADQVDRTMAKY